MTPRRYVSGARSGLVHLLTTAHATFQLNNEPYGDGWLVKIKVTGDASERADLLDAAAYTATLNE
jgi:glycine cleavage system H lipoate-binding protein